MTYGFSWKNTPGFFDFDDIYAEMVERAPAQDSRLREPVQGSHFVEIGVLFGRSTLFMAEEIRRTKKQIKFDALDRADRTPASILDVFKLATDMVPVVNQWPGLREVVAAEPDQPAVIRKIISMAGLTDYVNFLQVQAQSQADKYANASLDFVFIDADHTYQDTTTLISAYLPKLKPTGVMAGHDHTDQYPDVKRAVKDLLGPAAVVRRSSFFCAMPSFLVG